MKRYIIAILLVFTAFTLFAQDEDYFDETPEPNILTGVFGGKRYTIEPYVIERCPGAIHFAIDTIHTDDKYVDIVLFDDQTWEYLHHIRPGIDSTMVFDEYWSTEDLYVYRKYPASEIPETVDLILADENHGYCVPIIGKVTSKYRVRHSRPHTGVDLNLETGDTVRAAFDGIVRCSCPSRETGGYGELVIVRHSNGLETYYGHLSKRFVEPAEPVRAGDPIGLGGSTGHSTGPHLHFETRYKGQTFDPERIFNFETGRMVGDKQFTLRKDYFSIYSHSGLTDAESRAASQAVYYKVRSGDTLGKIAARNGTTVAKICKLNGISSKKVLRVGERLRIR